MHREQRVRDPSAKALSFRNSDLRLGAGYSETVQRACRSVGWRSHANAIEQISLRTNARARAVRLRVGTRRRSGVVGAYEDTNRFE